MGKSATEPVLWPEGFWGLGVVHIKSVPVWVCGCVCYVVKEIHLLSSILVMLNLLRPHPEKLDKCLYRFSHCHLSDFHHHHHTPRPSCLKNIFQWRQKQGGFCVLWKLCCYCYQSLSPHSILDSRRDLIVVSFLD